MILAAIRPDAWNLPLFFHIAGAMATLGSLVIAAYAVKIARDRGDQPAARFLARVLLLVTLPSFIVMRIGAQIILTKEHLDKHSPNWVGIGFGISDLGFILLVIALILTGLTARRAKGGTSVRRAVPLTITGGITGLLIVMYIVAIWAMTTKPT
jgi:hypothetical protein